MQKAASDPARCLQPKSLGRRMLDHWQIYLLVAPAVIYIFLFNYLPMVGLQIAFRDYRASKGIWGSQWVGLKYFIKFFNYPNCWKIIRNTLVLSLYSLATFPLSIIAALLINELRSVGYKKVVQMVTYAPHFISTVVICSMITLFMNQSSGLINNVIAALGGKRVDFLGTAAYFPHIYVWSGVWQNLGWGTIIYLATLSAVSPELHEAAYLDGANRMQIILHVNIPCILPTVVIMLIMNCGTILSVGFEKVYLLQNALNLDTSQTISTYNYELGLLGGQYSYTTAIGLFNTVVNVVMLTIVNTISRRVSEISLW
ncbi:MAG: ABC transporter permease subunit [Eubacteriales bacterium]|nr:ABC transporter permease subunit [Eubacteriales bacterium]